jgi:penicillin-insensitive murein endopeptidase
MLTRIVTASALSFVLIAGGFAVADRIAVAQAPVPRAADQPAAVAAPIPASPVPVTSAPLPPPTAATPPAEAAPPAPAPVVSTPPAPAPAPVVAAPPAAAPVTLADIPMPPAKPALGEDKQAAKQLFSHVELPSLGKAMAIGYYPRGCLQGGVELPVTGPNWQVMRLSRNRNWGHPELIKFLERFAPLAAKTTGWHGILVGDMAQPRGGPLPFGHMSHQIGLDVDIWFMPEPDHKLSKEERDTISASNLVAADGLRINPKTWTPQDVSFIKTAAEQPEVERVLVNAAIKKELCRVKDKNDVWMDKVRPWYGHADHIHVRLKCPTDSPNCRKQPPVPGGEGCGAKDLEYWFSDKVLHPKPHPEPAKPPKALTLADLPPACKTVLDAPANPKAAAR